MAKEASAKESVAIAVESDFASLPGDSVDAKISAAIKANPVVVFGKTHCPFCLEVARTFKELGVRYTTYNVDQIPEGGQTTVPYVFIGGELIGGCDATKAAQSSGELFKKLNAAGIYTKGAGGASSNRGNALLETTPRPLTTLFCFPEVVDDRTARFNGVWGFIICLLVAIFFKRVQAHWVMGGLMVDFCLRFLGGGNVSPLGSLSAVCVAIMDLFGSKPRWVAGQSKQFASLCGVMFSSLSFLFFLCSVHEEKLVNVGLAFACALGAAAAMEGFLGFCLGCWMFGLAIELGFLPSDTFMVFTNVRDEASYTWEEMNKRLNEGDPESCRRPIRSDGVPTKIDYKYKAKTDDMVKEDFNLIKHVKITHFYVHLGLFGLAVAWQAASPYESLYAPTAVGYAITLTSLTLYFITCLLYFARWFCFPQKVSKEWQHPVSSHAFVVPFIDLVLLAYMADTQNHALAIVLFWIGAPTALALSFYKVASWVSYRFDPKHLNAAWIVLPVANSVSALVGASLSDKYVDACQFWYAFAAISWVVLFVMTFHRTVFQQVEDDRIRPFITTWVAAPCVLASAYLACYPIVTVNGVYNDFIFINLHWFGVAMSLVLILCFNTSYLGRLKFDMSYWAGGFPSAALAVSSIFYYLVKPGGLSYGIAITTLAASSTINCVLLLQTLAALLRRRVFVPDDKWGPLSFMRLTHEALRGAVARLNTLATLAAGSQTVSGDLANEIAEAWTALETAHDEHSKHEDVCIFKLYDDFYPGLAKEPHDEHEAHHEMMKNINSLLTALKANPTPAAAQELATQLAKYGEVLEAHLRREEAHMTRMPRKHINLSLHKDTVRKCFALTPIPTWFELLPWIINNLPMLQQRVRFIKTLLWAMPERAQQIGMMVGLGVDAVQWRRITDELPEIIPRGAEGHIRYY